MLQQSLREATKNNHVQLEQSMFVEQIMNGTLSAHQYRQLVLTNYLVHSAVENMLIKSLAITISASLQVEKRHKLPALEADIACLKIAPQSFVQDIPAISLTTEAEVMGALYVLEGATLGGNIIVKKLQANAAIISLDCPFHYYNVYGNHTGLYWKEFCEVLNQQPVYNYNSCIAGAKHLFEFIMQVNKVVINSKP